MTADSARIERAAAAWLARRDSDAWSAHEQALLDAWLAENDQNRVAWVRLVAAWEQADRLKALGAGVPENSVPPRGGWTLSPHFEARRTVVRSGARARRSAWSRLPAVAAMAVVIAIAAGTFFLRHRAEPPVQPAFYRTATGGSSTIQLQDGSVATLSSDTQIAVALSRSERDIDLDRGEALFEVHKDASRPFVVHVNDGRVIAVGTRFAVRREGTSGLRVVVTHGLVRLEASAGAPTAATLLPAGSVAQLSSDALEIRHLPLDEAQELLSWRDGFVVFHDTPLAEAAGELNRYNARKLVIGDAAIAGLRVGGHFRWSNEDAFVRLIEQAFPVRAEPQGDRIVLLAKKSGKRVRKD